MTWCFPTTGQRGKKKEKEKLEKKKGKMGISKGGVWGKKKGEGENSDFFPFFPGGRRGNIREGGGGRRALLPLPR